MGRRRSRDDVREKTIMANETIYSPGKKGFRDVVMSDIMKNFPELTTEGHFDFNDFLAEHPELQGRSDIYNVLGGMNVADVIEPGSTWWSGNKGLSTMGGLYSLFDTMTHQDQDWLGELGGFSDWMRYMKGIGIQRDWNPYGLLYDADEADYYTGYYKKIQNDYQKMKKLKENKILAEIGGVTFDRPGPKPGDGGWSPSGADLSPGGGRGQSPTGRDIAGTPFSEGGLATMFERRR